MEASSSTNGCSSSLNVLLMIFLQVVLLVFYLPITAQTKYTVLLLFILNNLLFPKSKMSCLLFARDVFPRKELPSIWQLEQQMQKLT